MLCNTRQTGVSSFLRSNFVSLNLGVNTGTVPRDDSENLANNPRYLGNSARWD